MIKFTDKDNNKQFISIKVNDNMPTKALYENLKETYSALQQANIIFDASEIIIEIDNNIDFGFSLDELRKHIKNLADVTVTHFCVDLAEPLQRYY